MLTVLLRCCVAALTNPVFGSGGGGGGGGGLPRGGAVTGPFLMTGSQSRSRSTARLHVVVEFSCLEAVQLLPLCSCMLLLLLLLRCMSGQLVAASKHGCASS